MVRKRARTAAQLLVLPQQGAPRALLGQCVNARSLLPSSVNPREVYVVVDGKLHVIDTGAPQPALVPIAMAPAPIVLSQLLAMSRQAPPVALLALAQPGTEDPQASAPALWRIVIEEGRARAAPVLEDAALSDAETFFASFAVPRCREHGNDCLVIANGNGRSYLDIDSHAGGNRREWRTLEATWIEDARWSPTEQSSALLLARCDQHAPQRID
jgi:hypothetical protein